VKARDMSKAQFQDACERSGFRPEGFMGYYRLPLEGQHVCVSAYNAGDRRRDQLAYLHAMLRKHEAEGSK
jgi:hypothetical protein